MSRTAGGAEHSVWWSRVSHNQILLANIKSGVQSAIGAVPLVGGEPIAYLVQQGANRSPYTVTRTQASEDNIHLTMRGISALPTRTV